MILLQISLWFIRFKFKGNCESRHFSVKIFSYNQYHFFSYLYYFIIFDTCPLTRERKKISSSRNFDNLSISRQLLPTVSNISQSAFPLKYTHTYTHTHACAHTVCLTTDWNECNNPRGPNYFIIYTFVIEIVIFPLAGGTTSKTIIYVFDAVINMGRPIYTEAQTCNLFI